MRKTPWIGLLVLAASAMAQHSTSYNISDHTFNAAGHPDAGTVLASASYRISFDVIGDGAVGLALSSASFKMGGSFAACYPPPGEVPDLRFGNDEMLEWKPEPSVGSYNLYRDLVSNLLDLDYGVCEQYDLSAETATDTDPVPPGDGFFYLVTAKNRLGEEGTKGSDSDGSDRPNPDFCP